jgi:glycine/D-amino acid oxidase-like deaminating enzyme/nitrite reductase/ring-hydroxylating ferredoxin subunit
MKDLTEKFTSGTHVSFWVNSVEPLAYSKLAMDKETDVVIVGGGMAGVSIAYSLMRSGRKIILLEDGFIGSGETGRTTAHLVNALDDRYYDLEKQYGKEKAKHIAQSHSAAITHIEKNVHRENIDCGFQRLDGYLFLHPSDKEESLDKELEAAQRAGLNVEMVSEIPGISHVGRAIKFKDQAQFHPMSYLKGLCEAIIQNGGSIYTNTHAKEIESDHVITEEGYKIKAKHVVVATNSPVNNKYVMHLKQSPYRTYVIAAPVAKNKIQKALWWDTGNFEVNSEIPPYHYVRTMEYSETHDLLIVGGEDHPTGDTSQEHIPEEERYEELETWARLHFPAMEKIEYKWSGQVLEPLGSLAYIGHNPFDNDNVYIATGDSGNGMTHGAIAGMLITDLINGEHNDWEDIYDPARIKFFATGKNIAKEIAGTLVNFVKPKHSNGIRLEDIPVNQGKIVEVEGKKYGAFHDEDGLMHMVSATCTHLGCTIKWNNDEKSWDCPCHGSRFSTNGEVLNGPANKPLDYHKKEIGDKTHHK